MPWDSCIDPSTGIATLRCIPVVIKNLVNWALIFAGVVALFLIVYAGFKFVTSQGDSTQVDSAKKTLTYAIVGLLLILLSFAILNLIAGLTGVDQITNPAF